MGLKQYRVKLSEDEQKKRERYLCSKKSSHGSKVRGKILLALGENMHEKIPLKLALAKIMKCMKKPF